MSGSRKSKSRYKSKPPQKLLKDLAEAEAWEKRFNERGQRNTSWHQTAERLRKAVKKYDIASEETQDGEQDL